MPTYDEWKLESGESFVPDKVVAAERAWDEAFDAARVAADRLIDACETAAEDGYDGDELADAAKRVLVLLDDLI